MYQTEDAQAKEVESMHAHPAEHNATTTTHETSHFIERKTICLR